MKKEADSDEESGSKGKEKVSKEKGKKPLPPGVKSTQAFDYTKCYGTKEERASQYADVQVRDFVPGLCPEMTIFSTVTIYGKRKSGKSVFIKWLLQAYKHLFPWAWCFTLTKMNSWYESYMPERFILTDFSPNALKLIMHRQVEARKLATKQFLEGHPDPMIPFAVVMWDDYPGHDIRYNDVLKEYYYTGRHYLTLNIFGTQHITETPPAIRSNTDVAILFNSDYYDSVEHYWRDFAGKLPKEVFFQLYQQYTAEPYHFLAIVNDPNVPIEEKFYHGVADELKAEIDYIIGCPDYWKGSEKQLADIESGKFQRIEDMRHKWAEYRPPEKIKKPVDTKVVSGALEHAPSRLRKYSGNATGLLDLHKQK